MISVLNQIFVLCWSIPASFILGVQVHKIIGFAPVLLQVVMTDQIDMPVRQAGEFMINVCNHLLTSCNILVNY